MAKFKPYNYDQTAFIALNYRNQIHPGTFEYALHYLIEHELDLSIFYPHYKNDHNGRPAYDPAILLKIILFAYSKGITSSRQIQWCCEQNIIFKALTCDSVPHFTTIAAFISGYSEEVQNLFEQILLICHQQGLLGNELFAIDGCKMSSNASKEWSGTFAQLKEKRKKIRKRLRELVNNHKEEDRNGESDSKQLERERQTIDTLKISARKIDQFLKTQSPRMGQGKKPKEVQSNITDNESAKMTTSKGTIQGYNGIAAVDKKHQIIVDAQAFGHGQEHHVLQPVLEITEERFKRLKIKNKLWDENTVVTADTGYSNEANNKYLHENQINAVIPDNQFRQRQDEFKNQKTKYGKRHAHEKRTRRAEMIPASEFHFDPVNMQCICPQGEQLSYRGNRIDDRGTERAHFEGRLLQCRHCPKKGACMENPAAADHRKGAGRQVSFYIGKANGEPNYTDWMKERVDSEHGKYIYSHRMSVVEPVFANICVNKKLNRFSLRSKPKVQAQWQLYCMVHNIEKWMNYGELSKAA